jgi:hypothetical protein
LSFKWNKNIEKQKFAPHYVFDARYSLPCATSVSRQQHSIVRRVGVDKMKSKTK